MKKVLLIVAAGLMGVAAGCSNSNNKPNAALSRPNPGVTNVSNTPAPAPTPIANEQTAGATETPIITDTSTPMAPELAASAGGPASGTTYVVKAHDTLFHIAAKAYGSGGQWKKIAAANPGVNPNHLKVGQKLLIP